MGAFLVICLIATVVTKWVQDGRTDREYARKGMVSPRHQVRLARLAAAGRPATQPAVDGRPTLRDYLSELKADAILDLQEKHRQKRDLRGPYVYDPDKPSWRQRFTAGVLAEIDDYKQRAGWGKPMSEPATDPVVEPLAAPVEYEPGSVTFDERCERVPLGPAVDVVHSPKVGERSDDGSQQWTGNVWAPVCTRCGTPMGDHDEEGWLRCGTCKVRAVDNKAATAASREQDAQLRLALLRGQGLSPDGQLVCRGCETWATPEHLASEQHQAWMADEAARSRAVFDRLRAAQASGRRAETPPESATTNTATATTGGTTMTGEAVNYETTIAAIDAAEQQVSTIAERLDGADAAVAELRASTEQVGAGMGALRLDDASTAGVHAALESLTPETFAELYARLDAARAGLANARENVISTYGDAAATVAVTGVDESFLATA